MPRHPGEPELAALPIFAGVPPELYERARRREYRDGEAIISSGTGADRLCVLARGYASVFEGDVRIATRHPVQVLGEIAFIDDGLRSASVIASDAVVTWELDAADVPALMADPAFLRNLNLELASKLRAATDDRAFRYRSEERLFGEFKSHVGPEVLAELQANGELSKPRFTEVVAMFADVRGFTPKVLSMQPAQLMQELEAFLEVGVQTVLDHRGLVDKLIGDEVMALWGYAPSERAPEDAIACAEALIERTAALTLDGEPLRIGIGLEMGTVSLGVIGPAGKRSFTAVGPAVNLAARLQGETKNLPGRIAIGPALAARLSEETRGRMAGPHLCDIKGVDGPTEVWTLAGKG
jgi:class 3 adenylate cyclase